MNIYKTEHFGTIERIEDLRQEKGYTQEQLAEKASIDVRSIRRWKSGTKIRKSNLSRIAKVLDCDLEYLECTQATPRNGTHTIKLSMLSFTDRYLYKIQSLVQSTNKRFSVGINIGSESGKWKEVSGSFVDGDTRYYYEDVETDESGEISYTISINGGECITKTQAEMDEFVKDIMKFITYKIDQLNG